jgi:hypothetical protein
MHMLTVRLRIAREASHRAPPPRLSNVPLRLDGGHDLTLTHGRTRKRWLKRAVVVLLVIAGAIFFVAWAIGLALLILLLTY